MNTVPRKQLFQPRNKGIIRLKQLLQLFLRTLTQLKALKR